MNLLVDFLMWLHYGLFGQQAELLYLFVSTTKWNQSIEKKALIPIKGTTHPIPEQLHSLNESQTSFVIGHPLFQERLIQLKTTYHIIHDEYLCDIARSTVCVRTFDKDIHSNALIVFTSGTTGLPKGAVSTHHTIHTQSSVLVKSWYWSSVDRIHHILPLHHIHGIINALICPLFIGATVEMHPKFDVAHVWSRWCDEDLPKLTVFMSVPTVYAKLTHYYKAQNEEARVLLTKGCKQFRLMVSGSASLPNTSRDDWRKISGGQVLLERYGMTEIGMALSQEYYIWERVVGTVGVPLPGVQTKIMEETKEGSGLFDKDITQERNKPGMLFIKGPTVFKEYWQRPEATKKEFTADGWFKTGDIAQRISQQGYYQMLGRNSIDIIKTGGEKVSALEIEREILSCSLGVNDVAVVGVPDAVWGQKVSAVIVLEANKTLTLSTLRDTLKTRLAAYKVPQLLKLVPELPKNAMGKVTKKDLVVLFKE
ncbi:hypothetical protein BDB01DRAFT_604929 [Pilobolus umbonatus]|nr:hypothetical protein BDB01DRAFT_604929 [Pilobolus umbonatus]